MQIREYLTKLKNKYTPIKNDRIVFMSYNGKFNDSPKCVYEAMKKVAPNLEYIWLVEEKYTKDIPLDTKYCIYGSDEANNAYNTAHVIIDNVYGNNELYLTDNSLKSKIKFAYNTWCNKKKNQKIYSTWHGSPIKKMGIDIQNSIIKDFSRPNLTIILNDRLSCDILKHLTFNKIKYKIMGSPRNEVLCFNDEEKIIILKQRLKLPLDKKIVLFAPTFRENKEENKKDIERSGINQLELIDFNKLFDSLKKRFGGDWVFVCRFHYHVSKMIDWEALYEKYDGTIINGNFSDEMGDYLNCSDILISDVSSCLIDYLPTYKPSFLFFPDIEYYIKQERGGLYYDIRELPFPLAINSEQLYNEIEKFNFLEYDKKVKHFINYIGLENSKNSAIKMASFILKDSNIKF